MNEDLIKRLLHALNDGKDFEPQKDDTEHETNKHKGFICDKEYAKVEEKDGKIKLVRITEKGLNFITTSYKVETGPSPFY